jgi:hypothetical protein
VDSVANDTLAEVILAAFMAGVASTAKAEAKKAGKKTVKGTIEAGINIGKSAVLGTPIKPRKTGRRKRSLGANSYAAHYGRNFKKLAPANKKKNGSWKKDGFKRTQSQAHDLTRKERK